MPASLFDFRQKPVKSLSLGERLGEGGGKKRDGRGFELKGVTYLKSFYQIFPDIGEFRGIKKGVT